MDTTKQPPAQDAADRRDGDRRKEELPFPGDERRKAERRTRADRRAKPRG